MDIINEKIKHITYGDGQVISQKAEILSIQFSEQHGVKNFLYPDAFAKYLKPYNANIEVSILKDLQAKQAFIESEKQRKLLAFEEAMKNKALEKSKSSGTKKKTTTKRKVSKKATESELLDSEEND